MRMQLRSHLRLAGVAARRRRFRHRGHAHRGRRRPAGDLRASAIRRLAFPYLLCIVFTVERVHVVKSDA